MFFYVDPGKKIHPEYSVHLSAVFEACKGDETGRAAF